MNGFADEMFDIRRRRGAGSHDFTLRLAAVADEVVVTATRMPENRSATTESLDVFTAEDIQALGSTSLVDVLRMVPGLNVESTGREGALSSLFARGGESDYNLVLIDGVRVNPSGGAYDFSRISASEIDRLEVVRGGQSSLYGSDAIGSVVQVFTRRAAPGDAPQVIGSLEGGSFDTWRGDASAARRRAAARRLSARRGVSRHRGRLPGHPARSRHLHADVDRRRRRHDPRRSRDAAHRRALRQRQGQGDRPDRLRLARHRHRRRHARSVVAPRLLASHLAIASIRRRRSTTSSRTGCRPTRSRDPTYQRLRDPVRHAGRACSRTARGWCSCSISRRSRPTDRARRRSAPASSWRRRRSASAISRRPASRSSGGRRSRYQVNATWGGDQTLSGGYDYERESDPLNPSFLVENHAFFVQQQFKAQDRWLATVGVRLDHELALRHNASPKLSLGGLPAAVPERVRCRR